MKKTFLILAIFIGAMLVTSCIYYVPYPEGDYPPPEEEYLEEDYPQHPSRMDTSYFYDNLSPYGIWVNHGPHGYVWIPHDVGYGWRPYTQGRWILTSYGWTWISIFDWGWAPFHYGRWGWDVSLGWYWVPGTIWGPAWVTWRYGGIHIGWAPLPPETRFIPGVGVKRLPYPIPDTLWVFVDGRNFLYSGIHHHLLPVERNYTIIKKTVIKTNIVHRNRMVENRGIDIERVGRMTNTKVSKYMLEDSGKPGPAKVRADEINVYRPRIRQNDRAKPEVVVEKSRAREDVNRYRIMRETEGAAENTEIRLKKEQEHEVNNLKKSQGREETQIRKEKMVEIENAESEEEKARIEKNFDKELKSVRTRHKTEKKMMDKRHKKEEEKVRKAKTKKKEDKDRRTKTRRNSTTIR